MRRPPRTEALLSIHDQVIAEVDEQYAEPVGESMKHVFSHVMDDRETGERLWRLPLDPRYAEMVKGRYAQLVNRTEQRVAGAITAAELLHHFVGDTPWAHLDIAGSAWELDRAYVGKGASGYAVRLLVELARSYC